MPKLEKELDVHVARRKIRRRSEGDLQGIDIGIAPGAYSVTIQKHLDDLNPETRKRLLDHVKHHVEEALKPMVRLMERAGENEYKIRLFKDVGPNALRTVIEHLEAEVND